MLELWVLLIVFNLYLCNYFNYCLSYNFTLDTHYCIAITYMIFRSINKSHSDKIFNKLVLFG